VGSKTVTRARRFFECTFAALSWGAAIAAIALVRPGSVVASLLLLIAVAWSVAPFVIEVILAPAHAGDVSRVGNRAVGVTTILCVGDEPPDVVDASRALSERVGPTLMATTSTLPEALAAVETEAVLLLSASCFPVDDVSELATPLSGYGVGWVVGRVAPWNEDPYVAQTRSVASARRRARARRAGLVVWEPDAVLVKTAAVRNLRLDNGVPRGTWLRTLAKQHLRGVECDDVVARRAIPTDGPAFWPSEAMRRRAAAADLAGALTKGPLRARLLAAAELARELYAYQVVCWLAATIAIARAGSFPLRCSGIAFAAVAAVLATMRWMSTRAGLGLHPVTDARSVLYDIPGSLFALPSAIARRIRARRFTFAQQPLLIASIVATIATILSLLNRRPTADGRVDVTVALALCSLGALWVAAVQAIGPSGAHRSAYRMRLSAHARLGEYDGRLLDASPTGLAVIGPFNDVEPGSEVALTVHLLECNVRLHLRGRVMSRRRADEGTVVGIALEADHREEWIRGIAEERLRQGPSTTPTRARWRRVQTERRGSVAVRRAQLGVTAAVSVVMVALLALVLVGYRPLVVRSGSMVPTYRVGDIAIVDWVEARTVRVGDVVSFRDADLGGESVTHRIRTLHADGNVIDVETRGDANTQSEFWSARPTQLVGRVVARVPGAGTLLSRLGQPAVRRLLLFAAAMIAVATISVSSTRPRELREASTGRRIRR
jgi:signal peptidase I